METSFQAELVCAFFHLFCAFFFLLFVCVLFSFVFYAFLPFFGWLCDVFFFKRNIGNKTLPFTAPRTYIASIEFIFSRILGQKSSSRRFPWASVEGVGSGLLQKSLVLVTTAKPKLLERSARLQLACESG